MISRVGHLYYRESGGPLQHLVKFGVRAANQVEAEKLVLDAFWDDRLDAASCAPHFEWLMNWGEEAELTACKFCLKQLGVAVPATHVAPQHDGGDVDRPAVWVPVCDDHFAEWYTEIEPENRLPAFDLPTVIQWEGDDG